MHHANGSWGTNYEFIISTRSGEEKVITDYDFMKKVQKIERWVIYKDPKGRKMARAGKDDGQVLLHRYLFDIPKGSKLVWKNGNTLDLRRKNLQLVDSKGNVTELEPKDPNSTYDILKSLAAEGQPQAKKIVNQLEGKKVSEVPGVKFHKASQRWEVRIYHEGKRYSLGYFKDVEAAEAEAAIFRSEGPDSPKLKRNSKGA